MNCLGSLSSVNNHNALFNLSVSPHHDAATIQPARPSIPGGSPDRELCRASLKGLLEKDDEELNKYSVLLGCGPALATPMRPLVSPAIAPVAGEQAGVPVISCEEWGAPRVAKVYRVLEDRKT